MAPPPDDYGWAYVDAQRATASADGPSGSLQFRWGSDDLVPGQFSGSADLVFYPNSTPHSHNTPAAGNDGSEDMSGSSLYLYGNLYVSGGVMAETYSIRTVTSTEILVSGSTVFGDNYTHSEAIPEDIHARTGSLHVLGRIMQVEAPEPKLNIKSIDTAGNKKSQIFFNVSGSDGDNDDVQLANITAHISDKTLQHISINAASTAANHLVVDSGTGYVGVNCTAPEARVEIVGPNEKQLKLRHDDDPATAGVFQWSDASGMWCVSTGHAGQNPETYIDSQMKVHLFTENFKIGGVGTTYTSEGGSDSAYGGDTRIDIAGKDNSTRIDWDDSTKRLNFDQNTLVVDTDVNHVGIGVVDPANALEVMDDSSQQVKISYDGSNYMDVWTNASGDGNVSPSSEKFTVDASTETHLKSDTITLGINDTDDTTLTFKGSTNDLSIVYDESAKKLAVDSTDLVIDAANGHVGIGVADPDSKLEIFATDESHLKLSYDINQHTAMWVDAGSTFYIKPWVGGNTEIVLWAPMTVNAKTDLLKIGGGTADTDTTIQLVGTTNSMNIVYGEDEQRLNFDSNTFVVDGKYDRVGVGTATPDNGFHVKTDNGVSIFERNNDSSAYGTNVYIRKSRGDSSGSLNVISGDMIGQISWSPYYGDYDNQAASISAAVEGTVTTDTTPGRLIFSTTAAGANSVTERMRIDSTGKVGIGTSSPDSHLEVMGTGTQLKLSYNDTSTDNATFAVDDDGKLSVVAGGDIADIQAVSSINLKTAKVEIGKDDTTDVTVKLLGSTNDMSITYDESTSYLGIDETAPLGKLHVKTGDSGTSAVDDKGDELILESDANAGLSILAGSLHLAGVYFPDASDPDHAYVKYDHGSNGMAIRTNGTDAILIDDAQNVSITGSINTTEDAVVQGTLWVADKIAHRGDSSEDTYIAFPSGDTIRITTNGSEFMRLQSESGQLTTTHNNSAGNIDFVMKGDAQAPIGDDGAGDSIAFHMKANSADEGFSGTSTIHMSAALGPLTSSGGIHAANFVGNDIRLSGSKTSPSLLVGANAPAQAASAGNTLAAIAGSGSSHALLVKGGLSASHDVKVEHLYTNDLYISGTAHGIVVDRANYASSSVTTKRTYSPVGFDTSGYLHVSASSILGTSATPGSADTHVVTGEVQVTGTLATNADLEIGWTGKLLHRNDPDTYLKFNADSISLYAGGERMLYADEDGTQSQLWLGAVDGQDIDVRVRTTQSTGSLLLDGATGDFHIGGDTFVFDHSTGTLRIRPDAADKKGRIILHSRDSTAQDSPQLDFQHYTDGTFADGDDLGEIYFRGAETEDGTYYMGAAILADVDIENAGDAWTDGSSTPGRFKIFTTPNGSTSGVERFRISSAGNTNITGSLNVTADSVVSGDLWAAQYIRHLGDPDTRIRFLGDEMVLTAGDVNFLNLKENDTDPDTLKVNPANKDVDFYIYGEESAANAGDGKIAIHVDADASGEATPALTPKVNISGTLGPLSGSGGIHAADLVVNDAQISGSLTLGTNGLLKMPDNTAAKILVADGTSFQEVAISGDISISSAGAVTIANDAVEAAMLADDAVVNDSIVDGAIKADKLDIDGSTDIGAALTGTDLIIVDDGANGTNRKAALSRVSTYVRTDVSALGTAEASKAVILDASKNIATIGTIGCGAITSTGASSLGSISSVGSVSGSSTLQIQGSASFGAPVDISGDLVFHAAATAGVIDIKVNDGSGADTAIRIGKNGKVTKFGDDTPTDGQYLSWDALGGKIAWSDGTTPDMSGSDNHYSSTEFRTSGDLKVSGSITFGAGTGLSGSAAGPMSFLVLDENNQVKIAQASTTYDSDGAEIKFGADEEVRLIHNHDSGLIVKRTATGNNNPTNLILQTGETSIGGGNVIGRLQWQAPDESSGGDASTLAAQIECIATSSWTSTVQRSSLSFNTAYDGTLTPWLVLHPDGNLTGSNWQVNADGTGSFSEINLWGKIYATRDNGDDTFINLAPNTIELHAGTTDQAQITITQDAVVINEKSNSLDFRIESNDEANMFVVDGGNNTVEIAGGFGSSGLKIGTTGSVQTDGHVYAAGGFYTAGDLHVNGDVITNGGTEFGSITVADNIVHSGDANTKISFATDTIDFTAGNVLMLSMDEANQNLIRFNPANADVDFQVSTSATSGSLKIDGDTGDVHIGGDTITYDHSEGSLLIRPGTGDQGQLILASRDGNTADDAMLTFRRYTDGSLTDGDNLGLIEWKGAEDEDGTYYSAAAIMAEVDEASWIDGTSAAGRLKFFTTSDTSTSPSTALMLDSSQNMTTYGAATIGGDIQINGNDIKDSGGNTVLSFDGSGNIDNDVTIQATTANLDLVSTNGEGSLRFYGDGSSMVADDNIGSIRWYGTEDDGTGNSAQMGYILCETTEAFAYGSAVGTRMKFAVGKAGTTDTVETMYVTGESGAGRVGIGTSSPDFKLSVAASLSGDAGFVGYFNNTSTATTADGIRIRVGRTTDPGSSNTFIQMRNGNSAVGKVIGDASGGVSYLDAFTGRHPTVTADAVENLLIGLILSSTGEMWIKNEETVSTGLPKVSLATSDNDKTVFGVLSRIETSENPEEYWYGGYHSSENVGEGETPIVVNSTGEGLVWVTNKNGEVERGDYICSTVVPGYGGKQADDLLHSYTVAKCVETIDWASVTDTIEHDGVTYKRYLAACTYNCG